MRANEDTKLKELILYVAERSEGDEPFSRTKLNKVLFYADFIAYLKTGRSITGQVYEKYPFGPVPRDIVKTLRDMQATGALAIAQREYYGWRQERPMGLREPNLDAFTGAEIAIVEEVIRHLWGKSAKEVSNLSHDFLGWQATPDGEVIPYETALVDNPEPTEDAIAYAKQLVRDGR